MNQPAFTQLLVAADSVEAANRLISGLRAHNVAIRSASTSNEGELGALLARGQWDVLVCYPSSRLPLASVLSALQRAELDLPVVCVVATPNAQPYSSVRATIAPQDHEGLLAVVQREAEISRLRRRVRQLELQQRELEKRHALLMDGSSTAIAYVQDGIHLACNASYARCFGYDSTAAIMTTPLLDLLSTEARPAIRALLGHAGGEIATDTRETLRIRRQNGSEESMELRFMPVEYDGKACMQLTVGPARGNADYAAAVAQIDNQDLLTRLDNAGHFVARIEQAIRAAVQDNHFSSLLLIEIEDFTGITAAIGRSSGNIVLNDVARKQ